MMATNNIFSPANGSPITSPTQDIVMGVFYLTTDHVSPAVDEKDMPRLASPFEALNAYHHKKIGIHDKILVRVSRDMVVTDAKTDAKEMPANRRIITTVGRIILNDILRDNMPIYNFSLSHMDLYPLD